MDLKETLQLFDLKKIFGIHDKSAVGIDIGSSSIKVVELTKDKGRAVLKAYGELALGPYAGSTIGTINNIPTTKIAEALRDILRESDIKTKNSGMAIPFKSSLVSLIKMPALPEKKLEEMIPIEARKYIPVPISEVTLDWWIVPKENTYETVEEAKKEDAKRKDEILNQRKGENLADSNEQTDVLVVSIHNEVLNNSNNIVKANDLETSFFEIEMFSVIRSLLGNGNANDNDKPVLILDIGAVGTKLYIVERGIIRASHIVGRGSYDLTQNLAKSLGLDFAEAEKIKQNFSKLKDSDKKMVGDLINLSLDYIWGEVKNVVSAYEQKSQKTVTKTVITGGGAQLTGFYESAESHLNMKIEMGDPFGKVVTPSFLSNTLRTTGLEFAVAVGVALRKLEEMS